MVTPVCSENHTQNFLIPHTRILQTLDFAAPQNLNRKCSYLIPLNRLPYRDFVWESNESSFQLRILPMYKIEFCPNGPNCRYRHVKLPGPLPPVGEVMRKSMIPTPLPQGDSRCVQKERSLFKLMSPPSDNPIGHHRANLRSWCTWLPCT